MGSANEKVQNETLGQRRIMRESPHVQFCKWSSMSAAIFWMLVYVLSEAAEKLPNFVYVNF